MTQPLATDHIESSFETNQTESPSETNSGSETLYGAIDVGSNSVKIVIADLADGRARLVYDETIITRLGEGMLPHLPRLREAAMRRTIDAIASLVETAGHHRVKALAAVGTAALRDAENREELLRRVHERCGLEIEAIPGEEEARLSYLAVRRDPLWHDCEQVRVIDIGGGSTEVIQGEAGGDAIASRVSVPLGAVRLTERALQSDPPTVAQLTEANRLAAEGLAQVPFETNGTSKSANIKGANLPDAVLVGVGGTISNLGAMDRQSKSEPELLHGHLLTADRLETIIETLSSSSVEQRKLLPGLDPRRADIILGGAILLSQALARIESDTIAVSTRGLRWGLLYDRFMR